MRKVGKVLTTCMTIAGCFVVGYLFLVSFLCLVQDSYIAKSEDDFDDDFVRGFCRYLDDDIDD